MDSRDRAPGTWLPSPLPYNGFPAPGSILAGTRVLCICEDLGYAQREITPALQGAGLLVDAIPADAQNITAQLAGAYHVIIFDISSRDGQGYEICNQVHSAFGLPLMLVLHGAARDEILRGFAVGADAYILSPFDPREFLARLGGLLRRSQQHQA